MNKVLIAICLPLTLSLTAEAWGGQPPSPRSSPDTHSSSAPVKPAGEASTTRQITVSGCLEPAAAGSGPYKLTHGTQAGAVNKGIPDPQLKSDTRGKGEGAKETAKEAPMPTDYRISYELVGAAGDLKPHVGHRVEVTGSISRADLEMMDRVKKDRAMKDRGREDPQVDGTVPQTGQSTQADQEMPDSAIKPVKLNVASLKHISPTCP